MVFIRDEFIAQCNLLRTAGCDDNQNTPVCKYHASPLQIWTTVRSALSWYNWYFFLGGIGMALWLSLNQWIYFLWSMNMRSQEPINVRVNKCRKSKNLFIIVIESLLSLDLSISITAVILADDLILRDDSKQRMSII